MLIERVSTMVADRRRIQDLVIRVQQAFLDAPDLRLTLPQAQRRFAASARRCGAVLNVLADSGVLGKTPHGHYVRFFPRSIRRAA
ncbi:MAG: hypothetical protein ACRD15_20200 [Vicinamibacterales bacterium]